MITVNVMRAKKGEVEKRKGSPHREGAFELGLEPRCMLFPAEGLLGGPVPSLQEKYATRGHRVWGSGTP